MRSLLLDVGGRDNLGGEVKPFAEVVETLGRQGVVVVLPRELGLDVAARGQGLASLDDEEVADAGLVGGLIAARSNELASVGLIEDECSGSVMLNQCRISRLQRSISIEGRIGGGCLMDSVGPTSSQRP
jgi:hypothetical protein